MKLNWKDKFCISSLIFNFLFLYKMDDDINFENVLLIIEKLDMEKLKEIVDLVLSDCKIKMYFVGCFVNNFYLKS